MTLSHSSRSATRALSFCAIAASAVFASSAHAADLGGDCCADLEERIAELEATAARKGNRKVSLTVSGYVAHEITYWDDGGEQNVYVHGLGPTQASNFRFNGKAKIAPGWTAGFLMRIQNLQDNPFGRDVATGDAMNQFSDDFGTGLNVQMSYWYVESELYGKVSVGRQAHAAKSAAMFTDQSGTQLFDNYTFLSGFPQFIIRSGGNLTPPGLTWGQLAFCYAQGLTLGGDCNGIVMNGVRYDTPVYAGFSAAVSWGQDDFWEVAARYKGEVAGFKALFGAGYSEFTDEDTSGPAFAARKNSNVFQAGGYLEHIATGLFVHAAYGLEENNDTVLNNGRVALDSDHWYAKAGLRRKFTPLGATIIYGDYGQYLDQLGPGALALGASSSTFDRFGGGIAQEFDGAATTIYLKYERYVADIDFAPGAAAVTDLDDADFISGGAVIQF